MKNFWQSLKRPVIGLSPMDGVTDYPMRQIQSEIKKPDVLFTEFISVEGFSKAKNKFLPKLKFSDLQRPMVVQLVGYTPALFFAAVKEMVAFGFDGIDINMGCPDKSIIRKNAGAALISNYHLSKEIINQCLEAVSQTNRTIPLSVKTRIAQSDKINKEWFSFLSGFPLAEVTIHGRSATQKVTGPVNWERLALGAKILTEKDIIVLGNGSIESTSVAKKICKKYKLDGVLIGQAALGNPWVFTNNYLCDKGDMFNTILRHAQLAQEFYGEKGFKNVLKHLSWYPRNFVDCKNLRTKLLKTKNLEQVEKIIKKWS